MGNDKKFGYESLPIPSYDEAVANRPGSSRSNRTTDEPGDDTERQGLLNQDHHPRDQTHDPNVDTTTNNDPGAGRPRPHGYHPPTVESARNSVDDLDSAAGSHSARGSLEDLQRELDQMDVEDGGQQSSWSQRRSRLTSRFSKPFSSLTRKLSAIQLPWRRLLPNLRWTIHLDEARTSLQGQGCIVALRLFGLLLVVTMVYVFFISDIFNMNTRFIMGQPYTSSTLENFVQGQINETNIEENLRKVTNYPHIAGTEGSFVLAEWIEQEFRNANLDQIEMEEFKVYLNYPQQDGRRVAIVDPPDLAWEAKIEEDDHQTPVFHGLSKSGNATGHLIYANYGSREDFQYLVDHDISLNGSIALVRYYGSESDRSLKVKAAELAGAAGCIIYSDPSQDGFGRGTAYPNGRFMPTDGVQRGAVSLMSWVVGDVLTPGFPSLDGEKGRLKPEESPGLVQIPSIPIAWRDAQRLLQVLEGHGSKVPPKWVGGVPEVPRWWTGDKSSPTISLTNEQDEVEKQPIYNVLGRVVGWEQPDKKVIVGNHRDSWCLGSADPGSGTAVLLEVVRVFGALLSLGWRPLRTIEFVSWDAEEYNLIGSTEYVEKRIKDLRENGYAYLNVDTGVSGSQFQASASPVFQRVMLQILNRISDPFANKTLKEIWEEAQKKLKGLGAGSDYVAFQDLAGVSSIDFGFVGEPYPYHSCYENFDWMSRFGDPGFQYHKVLGQFWGLLLLQVADSPVLPFDLNEYATHVRTYVTELEEYAKSKEIPVVRGPSSNAARDVSVNIQPLYDAADKFQQDAAQFHRWSEAWNDAVWGSGGYENNILAVQRMGHNARMALFETHLLDLEEGGGIPNRTQFKHILFGPQLWSGYDEAYFPAIRDTIDNTGNWTQTQEWIDRIAGILTKASDNLIPRLK